MRRIRCNKAETVVSSRIPFMPNIVVILTLRGCSHVDQDASRLEEDKEPKDKQNVTKKVGERICRHKMNNQLSSTIACE